MVLFEYQSSLLRKIKSVAKAANVNPDVPDAHRLWKNVKIAVPLKYLSSFFRSLELPLINTKLYIEINCTKHSIMSTADGVITLHIPKTELYVPAVTLNTANTKKVSSMLKEGFKRSVLWNEYKSKVQRVVSGTADQNTNPKRIMLDSSFQGVNRLFVAGLDTNNNKNDHTKYFLPTTEIKDYNVLIDGRNFYDQNVNDKIARYNKLLKVTTGKGEDYTTGCLLDYQYYTKSYNIVAVSLSKQSILDSDAKRVQQLEFIYRLDNQSGTNFDCFRIRKNNSFRI